MNTEARRAFADENGVWQQNPGEEPFGIRWDEIVSVTGYKIDGVTEVHIEVELDYEYGEYTQFHNQQPGFSQVIEAITKNVPLIEPGWFRRIAESGVNDPPITVWFRSAVG